MWAIRLARHGVSEKLHTLGGGWCLRGCIFIPCIVQAWPRGARQRRWLCRRFGIFPSSSIGHSMTLGPSTALTRSAAERYGATAHGNEVNRPRSSTDTSVLHSTTDGDDANAWSGKVGRVCGPFVRKCEGSRDGPGASGRVGEGHTGEDVTVLAARSGALQRPRRSTRSSGAMFTLVQAAALAMVMIR